MRATRKVYNNTERTLELKSVGSSIALHVIFAALIFGVGVNTKKPLIEKHEDPMKAVLWVSTGAKKVAKPVLKEVIDEGVTVKGVEPALGMPEQAPPQIDKPSENVVKVPKKKIEDDPWLDELLALEPIIQHVETVETVETVEPVEPVEPVEFVEPIEPVKSEASVAIDSLNEALLEPEPKADVINGQKALTGVDGVENEGAMSNQKPQEKKIKDDVVEKKEEAYVDPYFAYRLDVAKHIQSKWKANSELSGLKCDIDISIMRDGTILMLHSLIGDSRVCDSAKMAIKRIRKLPSAPNDDVFNKLKRMSVRLTVQ